MSRTRTLRRPSTGRRSWWAIWMAGFVSAASLGSVEARQDLPAAPAAPLAPSVVSTPAVAPADPNAAIPSADAASATPSPVEAGNAIPGNLPPIDESVAPGIPHEVQIVRILGPEGMKVDVLGPQPETVPTGDGRGLATIGMRVGEGYRLRLSNIPHRPEAELFPVVQVVGHLHRPGTVDPGKYPIRVAISQDDIDEVLDKGRLVTIAAYLEDPDQALPLRTNKDEPPSVSVTPSEDPVRVAAALGRVMVVIRLGARKPTQSELAMPAVDGLAGGPCPFIHPGGEQCTLPCGPVCGTAPPPGRPWLPRDEFLCDGGDRLEPVHFGGDGGLRGIDPRDAVISFRDDKRPRVLPTNTVCLYAPRFASVRSSVGLNENTFVTELRAAERIQKSSLTEMREGPKRLNQRQTPETNRHRMRPSGLAGRIYATQHSELRVLSGYDSTVHLSGHVRTEGPEKIATRAKIAGTEGSIKAVTFNRAEAVVMTGIVEGPSQTVMTWTPRVVVGVEEPEKRPGVAVEKTVDLTEAEPGDTLTFTIAYRNMGNTPIKAVSIVDSLMPRLEYVAGSAMGPAGTVFTSGENRVGSVELRWDLPGTLAPGSNGYVSFKAIVR
ncbi:MAG: DUF11 domain-containing protein [Isosphaeraceae bacterium]|nr:DUF11 domain-containing protein [Isosphaeraceae bacterium]